MIIERFSISVWFALLFATSFAGAVFGVYGTSASMAMFIIAFIIGLVSLWFAYQNRYEKDALKTPADAFAVLGLIFFLVALFQSGLIIALIEMLFFLQIALNLHFREHRQVYFGLVASFVALMCGAINTFDTSYILFIIFFGIFACFYVAECHIDQRLGEFRQSQLMEDANDNSSAQYQSSYQEKNNNSDSVLAMAGSWSLGRRLALVLSICFTASIIYLITPRFPAGNLGNLNIKGWGKYSDDYFKNNLLPEDAELGDKFNETKDGNSESGGDDTGKSSSVLDDILNGANSRDQASDNGSNGANSEDAQGNSSNDDSAENKNDMEEQLGFFNHSSKNGDSSDDADDTQSDDEGASMLMDNSVYFYVKSDRPRYLQVKVKTYFDGASWQALQYAYKRLKISRDRRNLELYKVKPTTNIDVAVAKDVPSPIVATANTVAIRFPSEDVGRDYYDGLISTQRLKKDTLYQLLLVDEYKHNRLIDTHQAPPDDKDLQLPKGLDPRVALLAEEVVLGAKTDWQKAVKLEQHMRSKYNYSLSTFANQNNIPVSDFLFGHKTGHCEYFATSLALMLRTQGIPARMVIGFVGEDYNPVTGYYEVKGSNGHAWVSAFLDGAWVLFEGTGAYSPPVQNPHNQNPENSDNTDKNNVNQTAHEELKEYLENLQQQDELLKDAKHPKTVKEHIRDFFYAILVGFQTIWQYFKSLLPVIIALLICGFAGWKILQNPRIQQDLQARKRKRQAKKLLAELKKYQPQSAKADAKFYMQQLQALTATFDLNRDAGTTIADYTNRLSSKNLINVEQANWLCELIDSSHYRTDKKLGVKSDNEETLSDIHRNHELMIAIFTDTLDGLNHI